METSWDDAACDVESAGLSYPPCTQPDICQHFGFLKPFFNLDISREHSGCRLKAITMHPLLITSMHMVLWFLSIAVHACTGPAKKTRLIYASSMWVFVSFYWLVHMRVLDNINALTRWS